MNKAQLELCSVCNNRKFDSSLGILCNLTSAPASFESTCDFYDENQKLKEKKIISKKAEIKLFSQKSISAATYFGGPLAAGYMIGQNYKSLNNQRASVQSFIIGALSSFVLMAVILSIPDHIMAEVPNVAIPLLYSGIAWGIVEWKQGDVLTKHEEEGNPYHSNWYVAAVAIISAVLLVIALISFFFSVGLFTDL